MTELSEVSGKSLPGELQSIIVRFKTCVERFPQSPAIICPHQPGDLYGFHSLPVGADVDQPTYLRWSFQTLGRSVDRATHHLAAHGAGKGTVVFAFCENQVETIISTFAAFAMGMVHVSIGPKFLCNPQEVQYMLNAVTSGVTPSKVVFLANNDETAGKLDRLDVPCDTIKLCCGQCPEAWIPFSALMENSEALSQETLKFPSNIKERAVFFTSGTTSFPKACLVDATIWFHALESSLTLGSAEPGMQVNIAIPLYHGFGYNCTIMTLVHGACVVLVGPEFSPPGMARALSLEPCTHAALVPTILHALLQMAEDKEINIRNLKSLTFAGMTMGSTVLQRCQQVLGISTIENHYGMTEGVFISTGPLEDPHTKVLDDTMSIGKPVSGTQARVCEQNSRSPVPIGHRGVLHFAGPTIVDRYLNHESDDFYHAEGQTWLVTGDQAFMDRHRQIYIVGRHKDMIVCGGENVSPSKIEAFLSQTPQFRALEPHVVAGDDAVAGEVPILVTRLATQHDVEKSIQDSIREHLGVRHVPRGFVSLQSLGLDDFPRTLSGKTQKDKLRALVATFMQSQLPNGEITKGSLEKLSQEVVAVWSRVLGIRPSHLSLTTPIARLADSISILSARAKIKKETGRSVPLSQWLAIETITDQIRILGREEETDTPEPKNYKQALHLTPPKVNELVHLGGDEQAFSATKFAIEKTIATHGFSWDDVEDVFPCSDFFQILCRSRAIDTWNVRTTIISHNAGVEAVRKALEMTLRNHPLAFSYVVMDDSLGKDLGLYVTIRQTKPLLEQCILDYGTVETVQDLQEINMDYPFKDHAMLPGPLFRCLVVFVRETNSTSLITNVGHATMDATCHSLFHDDLDRALGGQPLHPHTPFKAWAESYHILRRSPIANSAVRFHAKYLDGLQDHKQVLWPHPTPRLMVSPERAREDGHLIVFSAPSLSRLRQKNPHLTTPTVLKAALALMVILHTNHTHALFLNLQAQRSDFPFLQDNYTFNGLSDAADVGGPTLGGVLNLVPFRPAETVLKYLTRMQQDQENLTKHASVPWHELSRETGNPMGDILAAVAESMVFDWMPGLGASIFGENPYQHMQVAQNHIRMKMGMLACAGAGGPDGTELVILLHGALANMSTMWVERAAEEWKRITLWLVEETSWQMPVGEFTKHMN